MSNSYTPFSSRHVRQAIAWLLALIALGRAGLAANDTTLFERFRQAQAAGETSLLPDYSHAGYHRCEKPIPKVTPKTHRVFKVTDYGAVPNDRKSDRDAAVAALQAAHKHRGPAVVYFPAGVFLLNEPGDLGKPPLEIRRSRLVLKGAGVAKTQLRFTSPPVLGQSLLSIRSSSGKPEDYWRGDKQLRVRVLEKLGPFRVRVSDAKGLRRGMRVNLNATMRVNDPSTAEYFAPHDIPKGVLQERGGEIDDVFELHEIRSVSGDIVTFVAPLHLEVPFFSEIRLHEVTNVVEECGIEDLSLVGGYRQQFKHHYGPRHGEDYRVIRLNRAFNCWVRRLRITNYSLAVGTWLAGFNTFQDLLLEGNAGHNSVSVTASYGNLFAYVRENTDTHHGLGVARSACNTVFLRCNQYSGHEAHCSFPRATLYDCNIGRFDPRVGGAQFYPHHDKGLTFWNWRATEASQCDFWPDGEKYGYHQPPIVAGLHGAYVEFADPKTNLLANESPRKPTTPASLFESQLALRLGELPEWMARESATFESISRHSRIEVVTPQDHARVPSGKPVAIRLRVPKKLAAEDITRIDVYASESSRWDGFRRLRRSDNKSLTASFKPPHEGAWVLRALMTNSRGEVTASRPVTIYSGPKQGGSQRKVTRWTMLPDDVRGKVYQDFVKRGGAEGDRLPTSAALAKRGKEQPLYQIEKEYFAELQQFYAEYSQKNMKREFDAPDRVRMAAPLFDNDPETTGGSLFSSSGVLVQAKLAERSRINRLEIHWKAGKKLARPVRFELQTSARYPACWTSVVNDEPLWEPSVCRLGDTLRGEPLRQRDGVTTLYFPAIEAEAVRLLLVSFPNDAITEFKFFGP